MKKNDIILLHGLNNNQDCFFDLKAALESKGYTVHMFSLLGYDTVQKDLSIAKSITHLANQFNKLSKTKKYYCIGFSQGGLVLQLLPDDIKKRIVKQVLLAPALAVRNGKFLETVVNLLPTDLPIISLAPKRLAHFSWLSNRYFRSLFDQVNHFNKMDLSKNIIPTLIIADVQDELVDVQKISQRVKQTPHWEMIQIHRKDMKFLHRSQHHVIFHPNYFSNKDWNLLIRRISNFLQP